MNPASCALAIRTKNEELVSSNRFVTASERYNFLAEEFSVSEWTARWICQGRIHMEQGGYKEPVDLHEGSETRAIQDADILKIREDYYYLKNGICELADRHAVSDITIIRIVTGQTYRNIDGPVVTEQEFRSRDVLNPRPKRFSSEKIMTAKDKSENRYKNMSANLSQGKTDDIVQDERNMTPEEASLSGIDVYIIRNAINRGDNAEEMANKYSLSVQSVIDISEGKIHRSKPGPIVSKS